MIRLKSPEEIEIMRQGALILNEVLEILFDKVSPGISLSELDLLAEKEIKKRSAEASFKKVKGYSWSICGCINEVVVHGVPDKTVIRENDVVGIDCGVFYKGYNTDSSWTVRVPGKADKETESIDRFLSVGKKALFEAIGKVKVGNHIYDISKAIQDRVIQSGYSVVPSLVGHGIGEKLHEDPEVPGIVIKERLSTPKIEEGLVIAVEVIYAQGDQKIKYANEDRWTLSTKDGKISGLFEATVAARSHGCLVLTQTNFDKVSQKKAIK